MEVIKSLKKEIKSIFIEFPLSITIMIRVMYEKQMNPIIKTIEADSMLEVTTAALLIGLYEFVGVIIMAWGFVIKLKHLHNDRFDRIYLRAYCIIGLCGSVLTVVKVILKVAAKI